MNIIEPEIRFLMPAKINGGMVSTPMRMAKKVVPQKNATQNKARYNFAFKQEVGYKLVFVCDCFLQRDRRPDRRKLFLNAMRMK